MKVKVLYFASIMECTGIREENVELDRGSSLGALRDVLTARHPGLAESWAEALLSVNGSYASLGKVLKDRDEVGVFTAMSGG